MDESCPAGSMMSGVETGSESRPLLEESGSHSMNGSVRQDVKKKRSSWGRGLNIATHYRPKVGITCR